MKTMRLSKNLFMTMSLCIFAVLIFLAMPTSAFAYQISYPSNEFRFENIPTYCIEYPSSENLTVEKKEFLTNTAKNAVNAWKYKLQSSEKDDVSKWNMMLKTVSRNDLEGCDYTIRFNEETFAADQDGIQVIGKTFLFLKKIEIYYVGIDPSMFLNIIMHEVGHSIGLGHYISDDDDINKSWYTKLESPSIMIPTMHEDPSMMKITDADIQKVRSIYGQKGFLAFLETAPLPSPTPTPVEPIIPIDTFVSFDISETNILVQSYSQKFVSLSGKISPEYYSEGIPVYILIKKPDFSTEILKITTTNRGFFQVPLSFDKNSKLGSYEIEISYLEHTSQKNNIKFNVSNAFPSILKSESSPLPIPIKKQAFESEIPSWVKNNAREWADEQIGYKSFIQGIQYLIKEDIIKSSKDTKDENLSNKIPLWIKNNAKWWADEQISDQDFVNGIQFLVENGIIQAN